MVGNITIPDGFKKTEIGPIPEEWHVVPLSALGRFSKGRGIKRDDVREYGLPCIRYGELYTDYDNYVTDPKSQIPFNVALTALPIKFGDLLFAGSGETAEEIGKCIAYLGEDAAYAGGDIVVLTPYAQHSFFLAHLMNFGPVAAQKKRLGQGDAVVHISATNLSKIKVPVPLESEQNEITKALSDIDSLISSLKKLVAKKQDIKLATMQQLLTGKKRLPGFSKDWDEKKIGDFTSCTAGGTPSTKNAKYWDGDIKWMSSGELNMKFVKDVEGRITKLGLNNSSTKLIPSKCVLIGLAGQGKTRGTAALNYTELCTNQSIAAIFPNDNFISEYLYYNLDMRYDELRGLSTGDGGRGGLNLRIIRSIAVPFPEIAEQEAIANVLLNMDTDIEFLQKKLNKTKSLKQGMMQELLTGRIRFAKAAEKSTKKHNWAIDEAVIISTLVHKFGSVNFPLGRKRYTKMSYLFHRYIDGKAEGYLKKAAGPYNPKTKYGGVETLACKNGYIQNYKNGKFSGFVSSDKIEQALGYFNQWYGEEAMQWLEQFRYEKNDVLELWATVDMAVQDLETDGKEATVASVKDLIKNDKEWKAKLKRDIFSDDNIAEAITKTRELLTEV